MKQLHYLTAAIISYTFDLYKLKKSATKMWTIMQIIFYCKILCLNCVTLAQWLGHYNIINKDVQVYNSANINLKCLTENITCYIKDYLPLQQNQAADNRTKCI